MVVYIATAVFIAVAIFCLWQVWKEEKHNKTKAR